MSCGERRRAATESIGGIWVGDSISHVSARQHVHVAVAGSHCGRIAIGFAARAGVSSVLLHCAGVGKDGAGIGGLAVAEQVGLAAGAVDHFSARIGSGNDVYCHGVLGYVNSSALELGVRPGMTVREAAGLMVLGQSRVQGAGVSQRSGIPQARRVPAHNYGGRVVLADSASLIVASDVRHVVITGSHGGIVKERTIPEIAGGLVFNDAGLGKAASGISRLKLLEAWHVPAVTVAYWSARIGDAQDTLDHGIISFCNESAGRLGVLPGMTCRDAVFRLLRKRAADY